MLLNLEKLLREVLKRKKIGDEGEKLVLNAISNLFREIHHNSYEPILIPQVNIPNPNDPEPYSIDLLLIHPVFGIRVFEIKNTENLSHIREATNQLKNYKNVVLNSCQELFEQEEINVQPSFLRNFIKAFLIYPKISETSFKEKCRKYPAYRNYKDFLILKEDLTDKRRFIHKILNNNNFDDTIPNIRFNQSLLKDILKFFFPEEELKSSLDKLNRKPLITPSGIFFIDLAQIKIVKNYKKGLRIIRGIAGTGKTYLAEELLKNWNGKSMFLLFNQELLKQEKHRLKGFSHIEIQSLVSFLSSRKILSMQRKDIRKLENFFSNLQEKEPLLLNRLKEYKEKNNITLLVIDEAQDFPPFLLNILSKAFENCVIFIDESQAINLFSTRNIKDAFKDIKLTGRVRNLKIVYRSPDEIFKLAKGFLKLDKTLNKYYREIGENIDYFESILKGGKIEVFTNDLNTNIYKEFAIGKPNAIFVKRSNIAKRFKEEGLNAYTYESIKGLEFNKVLLYEVDDYINTIASSKNRELLWRKLFVATTRAREEVIFHFKSDRTSPEVKKVSQLIEEITEKFGGEPSSLQKNYIGKLQKFANNSKDVALSVAKEVIVEIVARLIANS